MQWGQLGCGLRLSGEGGQRFQNRLAGTGGVAGEFAQQGPRRAFSAVSQRKRRLAPWCITRHLACMKTASVQQLPQQWPEILRWVAAGEEVQVTQQDKVIAKVVPATPAPRPDFLARAKAIWGEQPPGKPLSELVLEARGGKP